jgi:hypothetical protein
MRGSQHGYGRVHCRAPAAPINAAILAGSACIPMAAHVHAFERLVGFVGILLELEEFVAFIEHLQDFHIRTGVAQLGGAAST